MVVTATVMMRAKTYWEVEQQGSEQDGFQQNQTRRADAL